MKRVAAVIAIVVMVTSVSWLAVRTVGAPHIPNKVTMEEYAIYSAWTNLHLSKKAPDQLYFRNRTFQFDTTGVNGCGNAMHEKSSVAWPLIKRLSELGEAEYGLDLYSPGKLQIPWKYKVVDSAPDLPPGTFRLISFSRVAFNRDHSQALFAIGDACAAGECGGGGAIFAHKKDGKWTFQSTACGWVY
jgi:hypothetical protein